ncbi:MAG TPA: NAD(P)/FAD-dependent oxidoreductase [Candidatus Dormibacteraeota bacterium]|nr:NAD(P)/FAD-dependent oxidoreductase [Candidatus Dormibacteraeota bacterium]
MSPALDYDAVIVGGGPAGLTAAERLARSGRRVLLLERELYGGNLKNVDVLSDHPGRPGGISGAELASQLAERAAAAGVELREAQVTGIEAFSSTRWVACDGGRGWSAGVVVVATGTRFRKLGVPGEEALVGRGVIDCVPCDGGFFIGRHVAVCGADDHAVADARYLARLGARVTLLAPGAALAVPGVEVRSGARLSAVLGGDVVEGVTISDAGSGREETLDVAGVVIRAGSEPNTAFLEGALDLDAEGRVVADDALRTSAPGVLAAGDVRAGAAGRVLAAIADGELAAARAEELLAAAR